MGKIAKYLNQLTVGNVFDTPEILEAYAVDRSVLKIRPKFVALPESTEDIRKLMRFFNQLANKDIPVAVTARGAGLDEGGADLTNGIVVSTEKLNHMLEIDPRERLVRVQAGITLRELNTALSVSGLTIPISSKDDETIGGLISNCPIDEAAGKYGGIMHYVERIEAVLANGECLQTSRLKKYAVAKKATEKSLEGDIYKKISKILRTNDELIHDLQKNNKSLVGYAKIKDVYKKDTLDLMPLFFGAQGTLGIISEVILRAVPLKKAPMRAVATFKDVKTAMKFMNFATLMKPKELNLYDLKIIDAARESGKNLDGVIKKLENGFVVFASFDDRGGSCIKKIMNAKNNFPRNAKFVLESGDNQNILDEFQSSIVNYLNHVRNGERVPILTDFYLPEKNLPNFLEDLKILEEKLKLKLELYGSFATSIYSLRPKFNLEEEDFNKKAVTFLKAGAFIIDRQGGNLAGGGAEGRLKAIVTNAQIPEAEKKLYEDIKDIFDQNKILNPDVKLGTSAKNTLTHFRTVSLPKIMV